MVRTISSVLLAAAVGLPGLADAETPPYRIVLQGRAGEAVPQHNRQAQTSGGSIEVAQPGPDAVEVVMRGAVLAGSETHRGGVATLHAVLDQNFAVVPTRAGLRPPRLVLTGRLVGTLLSTRPDGGDAFQAPACAVVSSGGQPLLRFCVEPHQVTSCEELAVNDRQEPCAVAVVPGSFCLHQALDLRATAPPITAWFPRIVPAAAAVFDPTPVFDRRWNYVLKPFRAVPHETFGFTVLVQVVEEPPAAESLPAPRPLTKTLPPVPQVQIQEP